MSDNDYKSMDKIRAKFDKNEPMLLREACFVLWAEKRVYSHKYLAFKKVMEIRGYGRKKLPFPMWYGAFLDWEPQYKKQFNVSKL